MRATLRSPPGDGLCRVCRAGRGGVVELFPYRDALTFPLVYDLTAGPDEVERTVTLKPAAHNYAPSQLARHHRLDLRREGARADVRGVPGRRVRVRFHNMIDEECTLPYRVVRFNDADPKNNEKPPQNFPGMDGGTVDPDGDALQAAAAS